MALADLVPYYVDRLIEATPPIDVSKFFLDTVESRAAMAKLLAYVPPRAAMIASATAYLEACKPSLVVVVPYASAEEADAAEEQRRRFAGAAR